MALRAIEGWDGYGPDGGTFTQFLRDKWPGSSVSTSRIEGDDNRYPGALVWEDTSSSRYWNLYTDDAPEELIMGAYILVPSLGLQRIDYTSAPLVMGTWSGSSEGIIVRRHERALSVQANFTWYYAPNAIASGWNLIELKCKMHDTTGYIYLYVNGVEVISETDIDTRQSAYTQTRVRIYNYSAFYGVGDLYVCDTSGSINNDVLGPYRVQGLLPNANGDSADWTPSVAADNYTLVNEAPPSEADYVESGTSTDQDLYNYEPLTGTWDAIFGLQMNSRLLLDITGSEDVAVSCSSNGTQSDETFTITESTMSTGDEELAQRILETDPDTGVAWIAAGIDAIQGGVKFI